MKKIKKTPTDRRCEEALKRINKHIEKLVEKHLREMKLYENTR
jgi:hypothetical protein